MSDLNHDDRRRLQRKLGKKVKVVFRRGGPYLPDIGTSPCHQCGAQMRHHFAPDYLCPTGVVNDIGYRV